MLPLFLILSLFAGALASYLPLSERRLRDLGLVFALVSSGLALTLARTGFGGSGQILGFASLWYLDALSALMLGMIALISLAVAVVSHRYLAHEYADKVISLTDIRYYYSMVPVFLASMYAAVLSNNIAVLWIALEVATLSTTLLIAFYRKRSALESAWRYLLLCSLGMSLALVGVLFMVSAAGQTGAHGSLLLSSFRDLAANQGMAPALLRWAFVFLFIGLGTKVGLVPMHTWLPDAHSKAPAPMAALLSGVFINVAFVSLLRFRQVTDLALADNGGWTGKFFLVFGCVSIVVPALIMLVQKNYKRLLAYSSIEHLGLAAFSVGLGPAGIIPALMHLPAHALMKSNLFLGAGEIFSTYKTNDSGPVSDVWTRLPKTARLFLLSLLMLLAVPPSALFVSERIMIGFGLQDHAALTLLVVVALTLAFVAMLHHVYTLLFAGSSAQAAPAQPEVWNITHAVMIFQLLLVVALGIFYFTPQGLEMMVRVAQSLT